MTPMQTRGIHRSRAGPIGRFARLVSGACLLIAIAHFFRDAPPASLLQVAAALAALVIVYTLVHLAVRRWAGHLNPWIGAALALLPVFALFALGGSVGEVAAIGYVGVSLLVDFVNGDKGCEVMAIPALILRGRTHLACLVLSPLDRLEEAVSKRLSAKRTARPPSV